MLFTLLTLISGFALILGLFYVHYRDLKNESESGYLNWLFGQIARFWKEDPIRTLLSFLKRVFIHPYPQKQRWIYVSLGGSFCYLVLSGFFFALIYPRALFGILLVLHLVLGGVFAISLALTLIFRARIYRLDLQDAKPNARDWILSLLFWAFTLFGFILIVTALLMMLPWISYPEHIKIVSLHRYSALLAVLSAITFIFCAHIHKDG